MWYALLSILIVVYQLKEPWLYWLLWVQQGPRFIKTKYIYDIDYIYNSVMHYATYD